MSQETETQEGPVIRDSSTLATQSYMAIVLFDEEYTDSMKAPFEDYSHFNWKGSNVKTLQHFIREGIKNDRMKWPGTNPGPFMLASEQVVREYCGESTTRPHEGWEMNWTLEDSGRSKHFFKSKWHFEEELELQCWAAIGKLEVVAESLGFALTEDRTSPNNKTGGSYINKEYRNDLAAVSIKIFAMLRHPSPPESLWVLPNQAHANIRNEIEVSWVIDEKSPPPASGGLPVFDSKRFAKKIESKKLPMKY